MELHYDGPYSYYGEAEDVEFAIEGSWEVDYVTATVRFSLPDLNESSSVITEIGKQF